MTRRFGRNQRRRAREALAAAQAAHTSVTGQITQRNTHITELQSQLEDVAQILGTNFLGLRSKLRQISVGTREQMHFQAFRDDGSGIHTMQILGVDSSESWHRSAIHLRVRLASGEVVYSLS